ncbi:MAG: hypothetical protein EAZ99_00505 [Alphaproteobacteria bacterium]|nr:MAG: hypothetical protein EAZ99_00505 [Alphaproteobacteria bacterium]
MYVKKLSLQNYRCFESLELEFKPGINCLIGTNGSGKTAVLDAIADCVIRSLFKTAETEIPLKDRRRYKDGVFGSIEIIEPNPNQWSVVFDLVIDNKIEKGVREILNELFHKWDYLRSVGSRAADLEKIRAPITVDVDSILSRLNANIMAYRPIREEVGKEFLSAFTMRHRRRFEPGALFLYIPVQKTPLQSRTFDFLAIAQNGAKDISNDVFFSGLNGNGDWAILDEWFCFRALKKVLGRKEPLFEIVRSTILENLPGLLEIAYDPDTTTLMAELNVSGRHSWVPLSTLSSGYQRMLSIFGEIAMRCAILNPDLGAEAPKKTPGFVLIDELDLHLHPRWQREIVNGLRTAFPNLQFIFTTHAPLVIQSCDRSELISLSSDIPEDLPGTSPEDILEYVQGIEKPQQSVRRQKMMAAAREFYDLVNRRPPATDAEKAAARHRLDELMEPFSDDPVGTALLETERKAAGL